MSVKELSNLTNVRTSVTTTDKPIVGKEHLMVQNHHGHHVFSISDKAMLERFLIIGTIGGNYYVNGHDLTIQSVKDLKGILARNGTEFVNTIADVSVNGRAKNNDYALLALAFAITEGDNDTKRFAAINLPQVARTGTHLFHFVKFATGLRGWGKLLKRAVAGWYNTKSTDALAHQMVKYQSRDGWSHRDILRLTHQKESDPIRNNLYRWSTRGLESLEARSVVPDIVSAFEAAKTASRKKLVDLIVDHKLTHEMIPTEAKNYPEVWEALAQHMGATALIRNLNKMTSIGLIKPLSEFTKNIHGKLMDETYLKRGKVHPIQMLLALKQYAAGHGDKGSLSWTPDQSIVKALGEAFYLSFKAVEPSNKNYLLGIDVSSSMKGNFCQGAPSLSAAEAATVMAMVTVRNEPWCHVMGFSGTFVDLGLTASDDLQTAMSKVYGRTFGYTDCSLPIRYALNNKLDVDVFCTYTDNETNGSSEHPSQVLRKYRNEMKKPNAKNIVVGTSVSRFSIADPTDRNSLDVVGFDASAPALISEFAKMVVA